MDDNQKRIEKIFGKVSRAESTFEVYASRKRYPHYDKIWLPKIPYRKLIPFMEEHDDEEDEDTEDWGNRSSAPVKTSNEDNEERSLRQTKTTISDLLLCNEFDIFSTFTFSPENVDRADVDAVKRKFGDWLKNQNSRNGRFPYLIVPEFHKDKKSLHFHGFFKDYTGALTPTDYKSKGKKVYHFRGYRLGINSAIYLDGVEKLSSYVKKYVTKDMPQFHNKRRFWASKGLKRPILEDNPEDLDLRVKPLRTYENEYGVILYLPRKEGRDEE